MHDYINSFLPSLNIKEPDIDMAGYFIGYTGVHNINSRIIVFINWSRIFLYKPKLPKHRPQETSSIVGSYRSNNLWFCGTQIIDRLSFRPVNNCTPENVEEHPVLGILLVGSFPYVASTKHIIYPLSMSCLGLGVFLSHTIGWHLGSGRYSRVPLLLYITPQYLVIWRYLVRFFRKL